jgi:DNA invertase Pin-like site-specific DNA recombinase
MALRQLANCRLQTREEAPMRVGIYSRVSTDKQDCENQLVQLREFAKTQGWEVFREYVDEGISGSKADRPEFQQMFADASKRKFDLVLFWALDRLSREGVLETLQHLRRLESWGIAYRSFTESYFDSCGAFKDVILAVMATLAKQERVKRSERTKAGLQIARAKGVQLGRPKTLKVSPRDVKHLRGVGYSFRECARVLKISLRSVQRLAVS